MFMHKIRIGIVGYGNLGKGVELSVQENSDMVLVGIFTKRSPESIHSPLKTKVYHVDKLESMKKDIDVLVLCGGSATDLPVITAKYAESFSLVDSFDNHSEIDNHFKKVDVAAKKGSKVSIISAGWDPGLFSINRVISKAVLPKGSTYTFWGSGVSQGHSDAVRRIDGVLDARQYTIPIQEALDNIRSGSSPELTAAQRHTRLCYVVAKEGADKNKIHDEIVNMPNYFKDYETTVNFISQKELDENHKGLPHGGLVIHSGTTGIQNQNKQVIEYSLKLGSNPEFTSSVLVAYARAAWRLECDGVYGCKTVLDIAPSYLVNISPRELRKHYL